ncbi:MAG TPA: SRPBCC domain-containing protein [Polyangiaceae bacterium]|nr:SRPBCC domain-containing protein [Polyangiaceae bacterium]
MSPSLAAHCVNHLFGQRERKIAFGASGHPPRARHETHKGGHHENTGYGAPLDKVVTWSLTKVENGTRLRLVHAGFVTPKNDSAYQVMGEGWKKVVVKVGAITAEHTEVPVDGLATMSEAPPR